MRLAVTAAAAILGLTLSGCSETAPTASPSATGSASSPSPSVDTDRSACRAVSDINDAGIEVEFDPARVGTVADAARQAINTDLMRAGHQLASAVEAVLAADDPRGEPNLNMSQALLDLADVCGGLYGDGPW